MRESWVRPLGLISKPNKYGQYPAGAMLRANNLVARAAGELRPRDNLLTVSVGALALATAWPVRAIYTGHQFFYLYLNTGSPSTVAANWVNGAVQTAAVMQDTSNMSTSLNGWGDMVIFRNRLFLATETDVQVFDSLNPSSTAERTSRFCALRQPSVGIGFPSGTVNAQALGDDRVCGYAAVVSRQFDDGYELVSPPSLVLKKRNVSGGPVDPLINVIVNTSEMRDGDVIELYRTQSLEIPSSGPDPDPGTACYLVASVVWTAADGSVIPILDTAKDAPVGESFGGLGRAMYTNPGQLGLEGVNVPPPAAKRMAAFKGRMFYGNYSTPGDVTLAFRGGFGAYGIADTAGMVPDLGAMRASGIGVIVAQVGHVNGTPTLTPNFAPPPTVANQLLGMVPGQEVEPVGSPGIPFDNSVVSVGAGSFTMFKNATSTATGVVNVYDMIEYRAGYASATLLRISNELYRTPFYVASSRSVSPGLAGSSESSDPIVDQEYYISNLRGPRTSMFLRSTRGDNVDPKLPLITAIGDASAVTAGETAREFPPRDFPNGLRWSKDQQPEAVPPTNEIFIGSGEIYGMYPTRDALWIFASDGLWRLSGSMARVGQQVDVRVDPVDSTLFLACPTAGCVLRDSVYAFTNRGLVRVDDSGIVELSDARIGDTLVAKQWTTQPLVVVTADELNDDIYVTTRDSATLGSGLATTYIYSATFDIFTAVPPTDAGFDGVSAYAFDKTTNRLLAVGNDSASFAGDVYCVANPGSTTGSFQEATFDFQPVFAEDPFALKQWLDATAVLSANAVGSNGHNPRWNEQLFAGTNPATLVVGNNYEARINFGCPRNFAVFTSLSFGMVLPARAASNGPVAFKGASLRFEYLTEQQVTR